MILENDKLNTNKNVTTSNGSEFNTVKKAEQQTTISAKEIKSEQEVKLTQSSNDYLTNIIAKNTNRLTPEQGKAPEVKINEKKEEINELDSGEIKFFSSIIIGGIAKLGATLLMFYAGDNKDSEYRPEKEGIDRLTIILTKIMEKNKVKMKLEYLALFAFIVTFMQPAKNAQKNKKLIAEAKLKLKPKVAIEEEKRPVGRPPVIKTPEPTPTQEREGILINMHPAFGPKHKVKPEPVKKPTETTPLEYDDNVARNIARKIVEGGQNYTDEELEFQNNFPEQIEKAVNDFINSPKEEATQSVSFQELENISNEQKQEEELFPIPEKIDKRFKKNKHLAVADLTEEDRIITEAKRTENPLLKRRPGGQRKG